MLGSEQIGTARRRAEAERDELRKEHAVLEHHLNVLLASDDAGLADLGGATVLYLGGRPNQVPRFKAIIQRAGGQLIHHDGGVEDAAALLPGLVSRSDVTVFPVDCVSHSAVASAKRLCQQLDKRYLPLRTSSLACLLAALATLERPVAAGA